MDYLFVFFYFKALQAILCFRLKVPSLAELEIDKIMRQG